MFEQQSRYAHLENLSLQTSDGSLVRYVSRRLLPAGDSYYPALSISVSDSDRADVIAQRYLGDPLLYWQIADANGLLHPLQMSANPGEELTIPQPRHPLELL